MGLVQDKLGIWTIKNCQYKPMYLQNKYTRANTETYLLTRNSVAMGLVHDKLIPDVDESENTFAGVWNVLKCNRHGCPGSENDKNIIWLIILYLICPMSIPIVFW